MRHQWSDGEWFMDSIITTCAMCGGTRWRKRVAGLDYVNAGGFHLDMVGKTKVGWHYDDTPRSCPGHELEQVQED